MEENIAVLFADLTGYTALTERHGASGAADIIDKYLDIVNESLVGDSHLHEQTGDEVMIVSSSAEHLLATAQRLIENSSGEEHFLQVHGGLHYGQVIKRNDHFFGTTINLAARISAKANPGTFWCSKQFINAVDYELRTVFQSKGNFDFKNIRDTNEVFELIPDHHKYLLVDPVCKMLILEKGKAITHPIQKHLLFCDQTCLEIYEQDSFYN